MGVTQEQRLVFEFFYVGKGDCTLIEFPGGKVFGVIDSHKPAWRKRCPAAEGLMGRATKLRAENKKSKDCELEVAFVCVSHPHYDHVHGLSEVFDVDGAIVREFWHTLPELAQILVVHESGDKDDNIGVLDEISKFFQEDQLGEFVTFAKRAKAVVGDKNIKALNGDEMLHDIEGVQIYVINPTVDALYPFKKIFNRYLSRVRSEIKKFFDNISVAILFVYGDNALLYASDMQGVRWIDVIANINGKATLKAQMPVSVMKASHHGGPRSFYEELWEDALGKGHGAVIVSGGEPGHPSDPFIRSVLKKGKKLYCTGFGTMCCPGGESSEYWRYNVERLVALYGGCILTSKSRPCRGNIKVVFPKEGEPEINTDVDRMDCVG